MDFYPLSQSIICSNSLLGNPLGRVDLHEAILSKFEIATSQRIQLSLLNEPRCHQMFNLKRAILATSIPIQHQNMHLHVATTHLSAFSFGDGTLDKQVDELLKWIQSLPPNAPLDTRRRFQSPSSNG